MGARKRRRVPLVKWHGERQHHPTGSETRTVVSKKEEAKTTDELNTARLHKLKKKEKDMKRRVNIKPSLTWGRDTPGEKKKKDQSTASRSTGRGKKRDGTAWRADFEVDEKKAGNWLGIRSSVDWGVFISNPGGLWLRGVEGLFRIEP